KLPRPFTQEQVLPVRQSWPPGGVLVSIRACRAVPLIAQGGPTDGSGQRGAGGPRGSFAVNLRGPRSGPGFTSNVELAIYPDSVSSSFARLRRNLIIGLSASFTLMAALVLIVMRFPYYVRGQQLNRELDLARRVQADLLPSAETISPFVVFYVECI